MEDKQDLFVLTCHVRDDSDGTDEVSVEGIYKSHQEAKAQFKSWLEETRDNVWEADDDEIEVKETDDELCLKYGGEKRIFKIHKSWLS